jgi:flagellar protein FliJ
MKTRDTVLRATRFEVEEQRRKLADLETMINDFRRMAVDLDNQIEAEHLRSGVRDPNHFSYPPFAKAARTRRDNLLASVDDLTVKLDAARLELGAAEQEYERLRDAQTTEDRPVTPRSSITRGRSSRSAYRPTSRSV